MSYKNSDAQFRVIAAGLLDSGDMMTSRQRGSGPESGKQGKVLLVTSTQENEGKSYTSLGLARELHSITDFNILLIDADVYDNNDLYLESYSHKLGVVELPISRSDLSVVKPYKLDERISVLTLGGARNNRIIYQYDAIQKLIDDCKHKYDLVIIDGPSITQAPRNNMVTVADSILLVVDSQTTRRSAAMNALALLGGDKQKVVGCVLNKKIYYIPDTLYAKL